MTMFNIDISTELPDCLFVEVNRRFDIAIESTDSGLSLRVYPRTAGELWDHPFVTFEVNEAEVIPLEQEMLSES